MPKRSWPACRKSRRSTDRTIDAGRFGARSCKDECTVSSREIFVNRIDRRVWYVVAAVVVVLLLAWLLGWFGGAEAPVSAPATTTQ
jgi:hypothetical protein